VKSADVGGHKVYMRTLDVRTVGVAGGSMPRLKNNSIADVGPRSAHIAAMRYSSFTKPLAQPRIHLIQPQPADAKDYLALSDGDAPPSITLTPTCAANLLGLVPPGDCAVGKLDSIKAAFAALAKESGNSAEHEANSMLTHAYKKCLPIVNDLIKEYKLDASLVSLVGGGGGAAAIVPFTAKQMDLRHSLAENADVVSAIGVALALVRETIERQVVNPSNDEILRIRQEAHDAVQRMGADPATIDIHIEVDARTNTIRATASGATKLSESAAKANVLTAEERTNLAAESMRVAPAELKVVAETDHYQVFGAETVDKQAFGLFRRKCLSLRTLDSKGIIRLQNKNADAEQTTAGDAERAIGDLAERHATYGDAGKVLPEMMLLASAKIVDLSGLMDLSQVLALAKIELETLPRDSRVIVIADLK
jgi:N-methylhydantoinase A